MTDASQALTQSFVIWFHEEGLPIMAPYKRPDKVLPQMLFRSADQASGGSVEYFAGKIFRERLQAA